MAQGASPGFARRGRRDCYGGHCVPPRRFATSLPCLACGESCFARRAGRLRLGMSKALSWGMLVALMAPGALLAHCGAAGPMATAVEIPSAPRHPDGVMLDPPP